MGKHKSVPSSSKARPSTSKKVVKTVWLGKPRPKCKKCTTIKSLIETKCVICMHELSPNNVMLPKCQHTFCRKCLFAYLNRDGGSEITVEMTKLSQRKVVMDYLYLRDSPNQTPADFFYKNSYTSSLFHACNVGINGRLHSGQVRMTNKLRKNCNLKNRLLEPIQVVSRMLNEACSQDRCDELYRLTRVYSFECPVCRYFHSNIKVSDFQKSRMSNNVIEELSKDDEANADSDVGEAGPSSKKVAEVQPFNVALVETDDEDSIVPSENLYAHEEEQLEEVEDAVVPQYASNLAETPPPSPPTNGDDNEEPPELESNDLQQNNVSQEERDREADPLHIISSRQVEPEDDQRVPIRPPSPGKFYSFNMSRIPKSMLHLYRNILWKNRESINTF